MFRDIILKDLKPSCNTYIDENTRKHSKEYQIAFEETSGFENLLSKMHSAQINDKTHKLKNSCSNPNCITNLIF